MATRDDLLEETARDISAARAELAGRRDQVVAEYDDRLSALASLDSSLQDGSSDVKTVQQRVRQILGERGGSAPMRAGRTTIGLTVPTAKQPAAVAPTPMTHTPSKAGAAVTKVLGELDAFLISVLLRT